MPNFSQQYPPTTSEHLRDNDEIELYNNEAYQHVFNSGLDNGSDHSGSFKRHEEADQAE